MREAIAILEGLAGRPLEIRRARARSRRPAAHERRHDAHPLGARLGAEGLARGRLAGAVGMGLGYSRRPMSPDSEPQSAVELEAEQEVDFGRYAQMIAARWWLLVVGAVLGALIGFLVSLSDGKIYKATAQVYLGQPLAPDSAAAVTTSPTTLGLVQAFVTSEEAIETAASPSRACGRRSCATTSPCDRYRARRPRGRPSRRRCSRSRSRAPTARGRPPRRTTSRNRPWTRSAATRTRRSTRSTSSSSTSTRRSGS